MSDTQNKWIPVSERLPDNGLGRLVLCHGRGLHLGYYDTPSSKWFELPGERILVMVTHWMDLPELPAPPKPADPFGDWWWLNRNSLDCDATVAKRAWDAAKEHYAKPLPDFETWWNRQKKYAPNGDWRVGKDGYAVRNTCARTIWNAAQGKPEA